MDAIGYFRQPATLDGDNELALTLQEQEEEFFRFCRDHGYQPLATFIDPAAGADQARGYGQLQAYLSNRPERGFTVVVLNAITDLSPEPREVVERVLEVEQAGAKLAVLDDAVAADPLEAAVDHWRENRNRTGLSSRAMEALRNKAMRGFGLGKTPYGYRIGEHGRLEVVAEEAEVVRRIYQMYLVEGLGLRLIARRLNDENIPTRRGRRWSVVTVRDILRNRTYTGTYARFGVRVPGSHTGIISNETFRAAQHKRDAAPTVRHGGKEEGFALSGLAHCGSCGGRMIGVSRKQSWARKRDGGRSEAVYRYYRCGSRVNQSVCSYHTWRAEELEEAVLSSIASAIDQANGKLAGMSATDLRALVKGRIKVLDTRFNRYLDGAAKDATDLDRLRRLSYPLLREEHRLQERLRVLDEAGGREALQAAWWQQQRERLSDLRAQWATLGQADRRLALGDLVQQVTVTDGLVVPELLA